MALKSLKEDSNFYYGIEACNEVLDDCRDEIGPLLTFECLCTRAAILLKVSEVRQSPDCTVISSSLRIVYLIEIFFGFYQRKWKNDAHMAIRDCHRARKLNSSSFRPLILIADALSQVCYSMFVRALWLKFLVHRLDRLGTIQVGFRAHHPFHGCGPFSHMVFLTQFDLPSLRFIFAKVSIGVSIVSEKFQR